MHFGTHQLYGTTLLPTLSHLQKHTDHNWRLPDHPVVHVCNRAITAAAVPEPTLALLQQVEIPCAAERIICDFLTLRPVDLNDVSGCVIVIVAKLKLGTLLKACWQVKKDGWVNVWRQVELPEDIVAALMKLVIGEEEGGTESTRVESVVGGEEIWQVAMERGYLKQLVRYAALYGSGVDWKVLIGLLERVTDCEAIAVLREGQHCLAELLESKWSPRVLKWVERVGVRECRRRVWRVEAGERIRDEVAGVAVEGGWGSVWEGVTAEGAVVSAVWDCGCDGVFGKVGVGESRHEQRCNVAVCVRVYGARIAVTGVKEAERNEWRMGCDCLLCVRGGERAVLSGGVPLVCSCGRCKLV